MKRRLVRISLGLALMLATTLAVACSPRTSSPAPVQLPSGQARDFSAAEIGDGGKVDITPDVAAYEMSFGCSDPDVAALTGKDFDVVQMTSEGLILVPKTRMSVLSSALDRAGRKPLDVAVFLRGDRLARGWIIDPQVGDSFAYIVFTGNEAPQLYERLVAR